MQEVEDEGWELNLCLDRRGERMCLLILAGLNDLLLEDFGDAKEMGPLTGVRSSGMLMGVTGVVGRLKSG